MDYSATSKINGALNQMEKHVTEVEAAMTHCDGEKALKALRLYYKNIDVVRSFNTVIPYAENYIFEFDRRIERAVDKITKCSCDCKEKK